MRSSVPSPLILVICLSVKPEPADVMDPGHAPTKINSLAEVVVNGPTDKLEPL